MTKNWPKLGFLALLVLLLICGFNQGVEAGKECSELDPSECTGYCNANPGAKKCVLNPATNKCHCPASSGDCKPGQSTTSCSTVICTNVENVETTCIPKTASQSALLRLVEGGAGARPATLQCKCPLTCGNKVVGPPGTGSCPSGSCPTGFFCNQGIQGSVCGCRIPKNSPCICDEQNCVDGTVCRENVDEDGEVTSSCSEHISGDPCNCNFKYCGTGPNTALYCRTKDPNSEPACGYCSATAPANGDPCTPSADSCELFSFCDTSFSPPVCKIGAGGPCTVGIPDDCQTGYTCIDFEGNGGFCVKDLGAPCDCNNDECRIGSRCKQGIENGVITFACVEDGQNDPCFCDLEKCGTDPSTSAYKCQMVAGDTTDKCGACSTGTQANGEACKVAFGSTHCTSGYCEQNPTGPTTDGTCKIAVGGACSTGPPSYCQSGTSCIGGVCKIPSGGSCIGPDTNCVSGFCELGICTDLAGGPCNGPPYYCESGTSCNAGICFYPGGNGVSCTQNSNCIYNVCEGGFCKEVAGGSCTVGPPENCQSGYSCSSGGICLKSNGSPCFNPSECASGNCVAGACAP